VCEDSRLPKAPSGVFAGLAGNFGAILTDPPWRFNNRTGKVAPEHRRLNRHRTMAMSEIAALPRG
jgi:hypothetical protein